VSVLRGAQRSGASIVASGIPDGWRPGNERSEAGDGQTLTPGRDDGVNDLRRRMESVIAELGLCGLHPLAWEMPQHVLSGAGSPVAAEASSTVWAVLGGEEEGRPEAGVPSVSVRSERGMRILPDNIPRLRQAQGEVEAIVSAASRLTAVPDPWATAGIAPEVPVGAVALLLNGLRAAGYEFSDLRSTACSVRGESLHILSVGKPTPLAELVAPDWHATLIGPEAGKRRRFERPGQDRRGETLVTPGAVLIAYPSGGRPRPIFSMEGDLQEVSNRAIQTMTRAIVMFAAAASLALLFIYIIQAALHRRA
jgi:hypothetical protein